VKGPPLENKVTTSDQKVILRGDQFKSGLLEREQKLSKIRTISAWKARWNRDSTRNGIKVKELMLSGMKIT